MANYILDTNILSYLIDIESQHHGKTKKFLRSINKNDILSTTVIAMMELNYALKTITDLNLKKDFSAAIKKIENNLNIYTITLETAKIFSDLKFKYKEKTGINAAAAKKNDLDLIIAAIAIEKDAILVSNDKIFKTISENSKLQHIYI